MKKFFLFCFSLIFLSTAVFAQSEEVTTITITNARETSYKKSEETGNDTIILEGSVDLSVTKGSTTSEIKADKITYDRKTEMLYAQGNVVINSKTSSDSDMTTADSLLMNTSTLEGVFDNGKIIQTESTSMNLPSGSTLIVFSNIFGKSGDNVISFKNSSLTFCDEIDPHWHIDSTRTWLLPGGEIAFFNALLYVGYVPVLYLPVFYYPKDELVFNPVFSYKTREGYSVQTTTYLYGRKPLASTTTSSSSSSDASSTLSSLSNFLKPSVLKEQKLEGLVLHNLDENYSGSTTNYLKLMTDWYSNLGWMVGVDGNFQPSSTYVTKLAANAYLGFSHTIFYHYSDGGYYPFSSEGLEFYDTSNFLGVKLPFRYGADLEFELAKPIKISLSMPIYSDPYFAYDFKNNRSENLDWIAFLLENTSASDDITISEVSSLTWQLSSSVSPSIPSILTPYVSSFSASLNSSVNISSASTNRQSLLYEDDEDTLSEWKSYTPLRKFYYPSLVAPATTSVSISGTLFSWPLKTSASSAASSFVSPLEKPDSLKTEKEIAALEDENAGAENDGEENAGEPGSAESMENPEKQEIQLAEGDVDDAEKMQFFLPSIDFSATKEALAEGISYALTYSASFNYSQQVAYSSSNLNTADDFKWENYRSIMYTIKSPLSLSSKFNYGGNFLSILNQFSYSPVYQKHPKISLDTDSGGYTESAAQALELADYKAEKQDIINTNTITIKPFAYVNMFSDTSFSWNSNIKLYRREFIGDAENPEWESYGVDWDDEDSITVNSFTGVLSVSELEKKFAQSLTLVAVMPPLLRQYTATLNLTFPFVTASFGTGIKETTHDDVPEDEKWTKNPLQQSLTFTLPLSVFKSSYTSSISLTESFNYDLENDNPDSLKLSLSWASLQLSYVASYTYGYDFDDGWTIRSEKEFLPYSLSLSYSPATKTFYRWSNRISVAPGLSTSIVADLLRPTNSYFTFTPSITFKIAEFLDVTFSSTSRNSVLYWYAHNEEGDFYSEWGGFPGNIIKDLIDSFRFDNESIRQSSGFKLKSLNMKVSHSLHDWTFNFTMKVEPRLVTENGVPRYDFNPYVTIGVVWNPMDGIKTSIVDQYGEWTFE